MFDNNDEEEVVNAVETSISSMDSCPSPRRPWRPSNHRTHPAWNRCSASFMSKMIMVDGKPMKFQVRSLPGL